MSRFRVSVHIVPRKGLLDPQGKAVSDALRAREQAVKLKKTVEMINFCTVFMFYIRLRNLKFN